LLYQLIIGVYIKTKMMVLILALLFLIPSIVIAADTILPRWQNQGQNSSHVPQGGAILLYSQGYDNETGLRYAWLETNETGVWESKSIFYLNTFNDSSTAKNVTFNGNENKTVWIRLPKNSNVLSAKVKLKGYPYPNASLRTDDDTEDWFGWYIVSGSAGELRYPERAHDQNWNTAAQCTNLTYNWYNTVYCHIVENYTTPSYAKGAQITVKGACPFGCWMGPWKLYCWDYTANNWREIGSSGAWSSPGNITVNITPESNWGCWGSQIISKPVVYDNIGDDSIYFPNNGTYYEGMVTWYNESYTNSPYLNVGEDIPVSYIIDDTEDWWGWYKVSSSAGELRYPERAHDQNWNTAAQCTNLTYEWFNTVYCHIVENYTTPSYAKGAQITVKGACPFGCWMGPWELYCWNWTKNMGYWNSTSNNSWMRIGTSGAWSSPGNITVNITPESNWDCWGPQVVSKPVVYDNIGDDSIYFPNNGTYYEGMVTWYNRLNLDSDYEWQYSGVYSDTQTTSDFSKEINDYLLYCVPDASGYCNVSLMFHSNTAGRIELSDLNVTYISGNYLKSLSNVKDKWTWSNFTWKNDSIPAGTTIGWRIHYQDGEGNRNATSIMSFTVKIPSSCSLTGITNHTYGSVDTLICACTGDGITHLYRNETLHDEWNNTAMVFGAGTTNWTCNMTEGTNYASASNSSTYAISKKNASVQVYPLTQTIVYGNSVLQYCTDDSVLLDCNLYRNGGLITNNTNEILGIGIYNYVANISDTSNYTNYEATSTLTVVNCTSNADCNDDNECTDDVCNNPGTLNSYCSYSNSPEGTSCDDGLFCTVSDHCNGQGNCIGGSARDCSASNLPEIAKCDNNPDSNPFTFDYASAFTSTCDETLDMCTNSSYTYTHTCADADSLDNGPIIPVGNGIRACTAECDFFGVECPPSTCSETYYDYCTDKKLTEYDSDKIKDSTNVASSCNNACQGDCTCTNCSVNCPAPPTSTYCVKDVCEAECDGPEDCGTGRTCKADCTCTADITPPNITILSPQNRTYSTSSVSLTFTVNEPTSWCGYSLDGYTNVTLPGCANKTLTGLTNGQHNIIVYANDTSGNMGFSKVYFTVKQGGGGGRCPPICILTY
jgi:hypothetical protein